MRSFKWTAAIVALVVLAEVLGSYAKPDQGTCKSRRCTKKYNKSTRKSRAIGEESNKNLELLEGLLSSGVDFQTAVSRLSPSTGTSGRVTRALPGGMCTDLSAPADCDPTSPFRPVDGVCNNLNNPYWGTSYTPLARLVAADYEDAFNEPRGGGLSSRFPRRLPHARTVSTSIHPDLIEPDQSITNMVALTGLIVDHDMTFAPESDFKCCTTEAGSRDCWPLAVDSTRDGFYARHNVSCLDFTRSTAYCFPGTTGVREQMNMLTAYLDLSFVYGSEEPINNALREHSGGRMLRNATNSKFLPSVDYVKSRSHDPEVEHFFDELIGTYAAGDLRVNEMPGLTAMQTLWYREHNRLAAEIQLLKPTWSDEQIFQTARRLAIAEWQKVAYAEYLPVILGPAAMQKYRLTVSSAFSAYDPSVDAAIIQAFSTAAYRFGHTIINGIVDMMRDVQRVMTFKVRDGFFNDSMIAFNKGEGFDLLLNGMFNQNAQKPDRFITQELTNFLLREPHQNFGSDLAARNIQRARDHGVKPYAAYREYCGLTALTDDWTNVPAEISSSNWKQLQSVYTSPLDIDLFAGGLSEAPVAGGVTGPTFNCIKGIQLERTKYGDRFFFTHQGQSGSFTLTQLRRLNQQNFGDIICRNSNIVRAPANVFRPVSTTNPYVSCSDTSKRTPIFSGDFL